MSRQRKESNQNVRFKLDPTLDTVLVEREQLVNGFLKTTNHRIDYVQFYELLKNVREHKDELARAEAQRKLEETQNNQGRQASMITDILYRDIGLKNPLSSVIAIEDLSEEDSPYKYAIYFQINSLNTYAFRKITTTETVRYGNQNYKKEKRVMFDFGSRYVLKIKIKESSEIIFTENLEVTRKSKVNGEERNERIPFLENLFTSKLSGKSLNYLANNQDEIFHSMPLSVIEQNPELDRRILQIKHKTQPMDWNF